MKDLNKVQEFLLNEYVNTGQILEFVKDVISDELTIEDLLPQELNFSGLVVTDSYEGVMDDDNKYLIKLISTSGSWGYYIQRHYENKPEPDRKLYTAFTNGSITFPLANRLMHRKGNDLLCTLFSNDLYELGFIFPGADKLDLGTEHLQRPDEGIFYSNGHLLAVEKVGDGVVRLNGSRYEGMLKLVTASKQLRHGSPYTPTLARAEALNEFRTICEHDVQFETVAEKDKPSVSIWVPKNHTYYVTAEEWRKLLINKYMHSYFTKL